MLSQARYQVTYGLWEVGGRRAVFFVVGPGKDLSTARDVAGRAGLALSPGPQPHPAKAAPSRRQSGRASLALRRPARIDSSVSAKCSCAHRPAASA